MVYNTYLCLFGAWFMIVLPTLLTIFLGFYYPYFDG